MEVTHVPGIAVAVTDRESAPRFNNFMLEVQLWETSELPYIIQPGD